MLLFPSSKLVSAAKVPGPAILSPLINIPLKSNERLFAARLVYPQKNTYSLEVNI